MHANEELIARFYAAFDARDLATMASCYVPDPTFTDPAFGTLQGPEVVGMWRMLGGRSKDLSIVASGISADDNTGRAHWQATYTFSTGRRVVNEIDAEFTFRDGLIATHRDHFSFWRWSRQALGPAGLILGWTPLLQRKVQQQARGQLKTFLAG